MKRMRLSLLTILLSLIVLTGCERAFELKQPATDPVAIFDEVWNVIDGQYALFSIKTVDWKEVYRQYRSRVSSDMTQQQLFAVLADMLRELQDGHVSLVTPVATFSYTGFYLPFPRNFNYQNVLDNYLHNEFRNIGPLQVKVADQTAYIYYSSFSNDITDADMIALFDEIKDTRGVIIDVRNNQGGKSGNVDRLARLFLTERSLMKKELRKSGTGHTDYLEPQLYYLSPGENIYYNRVALLTNRACFSACNDFVLYMSQQPRVTILGDRTGGGGAIPYNHILANGWNLYFSASVTLDPQDRPVENGIEPDEYVQISGIDEQAGRDPIIERAIAILQ